MAKKSFPTPVAPRSLEDIKNEFSQLQFALGQQQYLASRHTSSVAEIVERLIELDTEANTRRELDAKVAEAEKAKTEEVAK